MGWIRDLIDDMIDWFEDHILKPFKDWVLQALADIQASIRNFMHSLKTWLAKWLQEDWFFCLFVAGIVVALIYVPQLVEWFSTTGLWLTVSGFATKIFEKVVKLININGYIDLKFLDTVLKTFSESYRDVRTSLTNSVAGLAADLGHGTGFLAGLFESARGFYCGSAGILGLPMEMAEIQWYTETAAFTKNVNDRFYHYSKDPGAIYYDFFEEVLLPRATESGKLQQEQLDQIRSNFDRIVQIDDGLILVNKSVEQFIALMPNQIEAQFQRRWDDVEPVIDDLIAVMRDEVLPLFADLKAAFEEREKMQAQINYAVANRMNDAVDLITKWQELNPVEKDISERGFAAIITNGESEKAVLHDPEALAWGERLRSLNTGLHAGLRAALALTFEPAGYGRTRGERVLAIPSPYVGEY